MKIGQMTVRAAALAVAFGVGSAHAAMQDPAGFVNQHPLVFPTAISLFSPVGFGADMGTVFGTAAAVNEWPGTNASDGNLSLGAGLGNGEKYLGLQINALIDSVGVRDPFGQNGNVSFKVFRWLTSSTAVAFGNANLQGWGALADSAQSYYGAVTQYFSFMSDNSLPVAVTVGAGSGAFHSTADFRNGVDSNVTGFGSVAVNVIPQVSVIADYTSEVLSAGVSAMPISTIPAVVTAYATNLAGGNKVGGGATYGLRLSYGYSFA